MAARHRRPGVLIAIGAAAVLMGGGVAAADPVNAKNGEVIPVACDNGITYQVATNGNGRWTPAHDLASNTMLIPTWFGPFHGVLTDADGNVVEEFTDPAATKGGANRARGTSVSCTFTIEQTFTIPEIGLVHFVGSGAVTGFTTPAS